MHTHANTAVFRFLLALVLLAPLPLGANRPWAWSLLAVLVGLLLAAWAVLALSGRARASLPVSRFAAAAAPFALAIGWAAMQTVGGLPAGWWHPLWTEAAAALGQPPAGTVSVDPSLTVVAILRLLSYAGIFWLAAQLGRERTRAREALVLVAVAGLAYAAYGLLDHFAGWGSILWMKKWAYTGDVTATFVNRNTYGAYAGIGVLCCLALFVNALRPGRPGQERRVHEVAETVLVRALPFLLGAVVLATAMMLSHSRGAFLSTGLAATVLMLALVVGRVARPGMAFLLCVVMLALGVAVLSLSGDVTVERLAILKTQGAEDARTDVYTLTLGAIGDAAWTGHGYGAFLPAFRMYRDTTLALPVVWDYAHQTHLETVMELGLPAALLLYAALAVVLGTCARGLVQRRRDQIYPALALAAGVLLGAHGLVDFSVQIPAVAATLALLLGVGYAQSWRTSDSGGSGSRDV